MHMQVMCARSTCRDLQPALRHMQVPLAAVPVKHHFQPTSSTLLTAVIQNNMAEEDKNVNPLLAALPPATDYITYLTIVEYNLSEENLPVLHEVLQDRELTSNIGWDLVHLLLPLLPASEECLEDIATRGNPREVILKVTEALRLLEFEDPEQDSDYEDGPGEATSSRKTASGSVGESAAPGMPPLHVLKFETLLAMLSTLHGRVKAKYPSRFLSTSLQAVLTAYNKAQTHQEELTLAAVKFVKTLSGTKRPHLPSRTSSGNLLRKATGLTEPDPEAQAEPPTVDEQTLVTRLFQSFITHILEDYVLSLSSDEDVPGLAWSSRLMEEFEPERIIPNKSTFADKFAKEDDLKARSAILGQLVALAQDLSLSNSELRKTILDPESETTGLPNIEEEPPSSATDIPLSKTGSLLLFTARSIKEELYSKSTTGGDVQIDVFPDHAALLSNFTSEVGLQNAGLEPEALLDAILALGLIALERNRVGEPRDDDHFTKYLQTTSLISANTPSPSLRYHAHYLTSTILRSHPSDVVRLTFIRDTLEHCPYENLKASAVAWLKGETLEANMQHHSHSHDGENKHDDDSSIFATPVALQTVRPYLFPDLSQSWTSTGELSEGWMQFKQELGFYLAALNFYYLLLTAKVLHENLDIVGLHRESGIEESYLKPLKEVIGKFREGLKEGGGLAVVEGDEGIASAQGDLQLLEDVLGRVERGIKGLTGA
jgi:hypothetical protein